MKWAKIAALVLLVLAVMRAGSWVPGWALTKLAPRRMKLALAVANVLAFAVFAIFLLSRLAPGEPVDYEALAFGFIVFAVYCLVDLRWTPWKRRA